HSEAPAGPARGRRVRAGIGGRRADRGLDPPRGPRAGREAGARAAARRERRPALALRPAALGPHAGRAPVRPRSLARDLQARAAADLRLLLPARARGRAAWW